MRINLKRAHHHTKRINTLVGNDLGETNPLKISSNDEKFETLQVFGFSILQLCNLVPALPADNNYFKFKTLLPCVSFYRYHFLSFCFELLNLIQT